MPMRPQGLAQGRGGEDRPRRAVEGREEPVTRRVELPSLEPRELSTNDRVMLLQELAPSRVSEARRQLRRTHDVGEQDRGKHALRLVPSAEARDEARGGPHRRAVDLVIHPGVDAAEGWQLDHLGSADAGRRVVPGSWQRRPWHDEGRYSDGREDVAHIELHGRAERRQGGAWTQAAAHVPDEPVDEVGLVRHLGSPLPGEVFEIVTRSPPCPHLRQLPPPVVLGLSPRVILRTDTLHSRVEEDEARATLRIGSREQDRDAGRGAAGPDDRALGADGVHDGPDVVHGRLERLDLADAVGEPRPAPVQHDHPPGRRRVPRRGGRAVAAPRSRADPR